MRRFKQIIWFIVFYIAIIAVRGFWAAYRHPEYTAEQIGYASPPNFFITLIVLYFFITYLSDRGWLPGIPAPPPTHKPFRIEDLPWPQKQEEKSPSASQPPDASDRG